MEVIVLRPMEAVHMRALPVLVGVAAVVAVVLLLTARHPRADARLLKQAGFVVSAVFTFIGGAFIVGDAFADPGGWAALGLVAAWAVPLIALAAVSWFRPDLATRLLGVLMTVAVGLSVWFALDPQWWRTVENDIGPIRAVAVFVLAAAVAVLGLRRTAVAGVMLLVLGVVPVVVSSLGSRGGIPSLAATSLAPVVSGVLYLLSARVARGAGSPDMEASGERRPHAA